MGPGSGNPGYEGVVPGQVQHPPLASMGPGSGNPGYGDVVFRSFRAESLKLQWVQGQVTLVMLTRRSPSFTSFR